MSNPENEFQPDHSRGRVSELEHQHAQLNMEFDGLVTEADEIIGREEPNMDRLEQIHERQREIIDELWKIEQEIFKLKEGNQTQ